MLRIRILPFRGRAYSGRGIEFVLERMQSCVTLLLRRNSRDSEPILLVFAVISGRHSVTTPPCQLRP
jgi:hypothetical protein